MKKLFSCVCVLSLLMTCLTSAKAFEYDEGNGYYDMDLGNEENNSLTRVYSGYQRAGNYLIYMDDLVYAYNQNAAYGPSYSFASQVFEADYIHGSWFRINTYAGKKWINAADGLVEEIINYGSSSFNIKKTLRVYSDPFAESKYFSSYVSPGNYTVTKKAGDFFYLSGLGWVQSNTGTGSFNGISGILESNEIHGIPLTKQMIGYSTNKRPGEAMKPLYVTIHNTANEGVGADAKAHANLNSRNDGKYSSWHFSVDNHSIYQSIPMNEISYHAGDGAGMGNSSTISIEICENSDGNYAASERNAAYLTAAILKYYNLPSDAVVMHNFWSGKNCPHNIIDGTKGSLGWTNFKNLVKQEYDSLGEQDKEYYIKSGNFLGQDMAKTAQKSIEGLTGLSSTIYETGQSKVSYQVMTGGFAGLESVQNAQKIVDKMGYNTKIEKIGKTTGTKVEIYNVVTGGFRGIDTVTDAYNRLVKNTGWYAKIEKTGDNIYRIVAGGFGGLDAVEKAASKVKNTYGWWVSYAHVRDEYRNQEDLYRIRINKEFAQQSEAESVRSKLQNSTGWYIGVSNLKIPYYGLKTEKTTKKDADYKSKLITDKLKYWNAVVY